MEIVYVCPKCGYKCKVDAQQYEEVLSYADPHNPYDGEWLMCPGCYNIEDVMNGVPVYIPIGSGLFLKSAKLVSDGCGLFIKTNNEVKLWI